MDRLETLRPKEIWSVCSNLFYRGIKACGENGRVSTNHCLSQTSLILIINTSVYIKNYNVVWPRYRNTNNHKFMKNKIQVGDPQKYSHLWHTQVLPASEFPEPESVTNRGWFYIQLDGLTSKWLLCVLNYKAFPSGAVLSWHKTAAY